MTSLPIDNIGVMPHGKISYDHANLTAEEVGSALLESQKCFDILLYDIQTVTVLFGKDISIMPMQCREAIKSLENVQQHVERLRSLLDEPGHLPPVFTALRYRLVFQIHRIEKQAQQLICFIESYRAICNGIISSFGSRQRRKQICDALETLSGAVSDISQQIKFIKHEAYFHQVKLIAHANSRKLNNTAEENDSNKNRTLCLFEQ